MQLACGTAHEYVRRQWRSLSLLKLLLRLQNWRRLLRWARRQRQRFRHASSRQPPRRAAAHTCATERNQSGFLQLFSLQQQATMQSQNVVFKSAPSGCCAFPPGRPLGEDAELRELRGADGDGEPPLMLLWPPCSAQQRKTIRRRRAHIEGMPWLQLGHARLPVSSTVAARDTSSPRAGHGCGASTTACSETGGAAAVKHLAAAGHQNPETWAACSSCSGSACCASSRARSQSCLGFRV
jgi:hypothetical protein